MIGNMKVNEQGFRTSAEVFLTSLLGSDFLNYLEPISYLLLFPNSSKTKRRAPQNAEGTSCPLGWELGFQMACLRKQRERVYFFTSSGTQGRMIELDAHHNT